MKLFKNTQNEIYAYELDGSQDSYIPKEFIAITDEEADAIRLTNQEPVVKTYTPLSAWQVRKVLTQFELRDAVEGAVTQADQATKDAWAYANEFTRDSALLNNMATALSMTDEQLDQLFEIGATL